MKHTPKVDEGRKTVGRAKGSPKQGGRKKGTPNKRTADITEQLKALDCDPIAGMAEIASKAMGFQDFVLAGTMFKELAQYVAPKRKSVEITGADGEAVSHKWTVEVINAKDTTSS